jgi:hypothetical protein
MSNRIGLTLLLQSCDKTDMKFKLSAGIIIGKHLVPDSISCNSTRTLIHGELFHSKHAEHGAVLYLKNKKIRKNTKLIVVRLDSDGNLVNSTPCESCIRRIKQAGIKKVIYVNEAQKLIESRVENIKFIPSTKKSVLDWFNKVKYT